MKIDRKAQQTNEKAQQTNKKAQVDEKTQINKKAQRPHEKQITGEQVGGYSSPRKTPTRFEIR